MMRWRQYESTWCIWPPNPIGLVEVIGGSYFSASPQISYKNLLEGLSEQNFAIHAWSYIPGLDHQSLANAAWKELRYCRKILNDRLQRDISVVRIGHSLGCKLQLLAPDGGRNCNGVISISFNNFSAVKSIPLISEITPKLGINAEFSPSPNETIEIIGNNYFQKKNLIINYSNDKLDESNLLIKILKRRINDQSEIVLIRGDHLTPISTGFRRKLLGDFANTAVKNRSINDLIKIITEWN